MVGPVVGPAVGPGEAPWEAVRLYVHHVGHRSEPDKEIWNHEQKGGNPSPTIG